MRLAVTDFKGMVPKRSSRKLPEGFAQNSHNFNLWSGDLSAIKAPLALAALAKSGVIRSFYPLNDMIYLQWTTDVDVAPAVQRVAQEGQVYYTGDGVPRMTTLELATATPADPADAGCYPIESYALGVPGPPIAPVVATAMAGGVTPGPDETRSYVYAYRTQFDELGPPSPAKTATGPDNAVNWTVRDLEAPVNAGSLSAITLGATTVTLDFGRTHHLRVGERIVVAGVVGTGTVPTLNAVHAVTTIPSPTTATLTTAVTGAVTTPGTWTREASLNLANLVIEIYRTDRTGTFRYVGEQAAALPIFTDTLVETGLGDRLESTLWVAPPADLHSLNAMANGYYIAASGREVCVTPIDVPSAWPESFRLSLPYNIVGIGVYGNTAIITTDGFPYAATGTHPQGLSLRRLNLREPCVSARSIVDFHNGVMYASPDGLVFATANGAQIATRALLDYEDWTAYNPASMHAAHHEDRYIAFFSGARLTNSSEEVELTAGALVFDPDEQSAQFTLLSTTATASHSDLSSARMLYVDAMNEVNRFDEGPFEQNTYWQSQVFLMPMPLNLNACYIRFRFTAGPPTAEQDAQRAAAVRAVTDAIAAGRVTAYGYFAGAPVGYYPVGGGPYTNALRFSELPSGLLFSLYADGELKFSKALTKSEEFRLPSGYEADEYYFELFGNQVEVYEVEMAEWLEELSA